MQISRTFVTCLLATTTALTLARETPAATTGAELREVVVSHTDEKGILQLFRIKEDGSNRRKLTHSKRGCRMPAWSPDGKWIAHREGVEMVHMSKFTGIPNPKRDQLISKTFHVWVVDRGGKKRRKVGRGDDPNWLPERARLRLKNNSEKQ